MKVLFTLHTPLLMPDIYINNFQDTPFAYTRYIHKDRMVSGTLVFLDRLILSFFSQTNNNNNNNLYAA